LVVRVVVPHGLFEGWWHPPEDPASVYMESTWDLLPSKFEGTVKESFVPSGREVGKVNCYHGLTRAVAVDLH
jgi:hypothetical protein